MKRSLRTGLPVASTAPALARSRVCGVCRHFDGHSIAGIGLCAVHGAKVRGRRAAGDCEHWSRPWLHEVHPPPPPPLEMYRAGAPLAEICAEHGIHPATLDRMRRRAGIPKRRQGGPSRFAEVAALLERGMRQVDIALALGMSPAAVSQHARAWRGMQA